MSFDVFANNKIICKDCLYHDKTMLEVDGNIIPAGITKVTCDVYGYPYAKPKGVLSGNGNCKYYKKE